MVGRENLASAVALNTTMVTGASFIGPAIAGVAIKVLGEGWCFFVNGASFLAVIAGLLAMRDLPPPTKGPDGRPGTRRRSRGPRPRIASPYQFLPLDRRRVRYVRRASRVMAIWFMILMGFAPVGSVIAGSITTALGPCIVMAVGSAVCALGAIGFARWSWTRGRRSASLFPGHPSA
jgi:MFS family permease